MPINFRQLEVFRAVATTRSFTRASHILLISQSTVSQHIRELEDSLQVKLFERNRRNVYLSPAGEGLLEQSRRIFGMLEAAESAAKTRATPYSGPLAFGCASSTLLYQLPPILVEYARAYPEVELNITDGTIQDVASQLLAGALDLALVVLPLTAPGLRKIILSNESFVAVLPAQHPLAKLPKLNIRDLVHERFVMHRRGQNTRKLIDRYFYKRKISPRVAIEVAETEAIKEMVARGLGISLLPESAFKGGRDARGLKTFPIGGKELQRTLALVYLRPKSLRPPALAMIELLKSHFRGKGASVKA
jgi:DNA-binding transcriptional LysR family regulator